MTKKRTKKKSGKLGWLVLIISLLIISSITINLYHNKSCVDRGHDGVAVLLFVPVGCYEENTEDSCKDNDDEYKIYPLFD